MTVMQTGINNAEHLSRITVEPLNVDSLKCKNLHIQDTFVKPQCNRIIVLIHP